MKHHWSIRRQQEIIPDATRRWDQVYQLLLTWSQILPPAMESPSSTEEEINESSELRPCLDSTSSPSSLMK